MDRLAVVRNVASQITDIPDDPFSVGRSYLVGKLEEYCDDLEFMALKNLADASSEELGTGLKTLQVMVAAAHTEYFAEANRLHDEIARELKHRTTTAQEGLDRARALRERGRDEVRLIAKRARNFQVAALTGLAAVSFVLGAGVEAAVGLDGWWGLAVSTGVAIATFAVVDLVVSPRWLEPLIRRRNRRAFAKAIDPLVQSYRDVAVSVSAVNSVLTKGDDEESDEVELRVSSDRTDQR